MAPDVQARDAMESERVEAGWAALRGKVEAELGAWRRKHARATFAELEAVTRTAVSQLQARYLEDMAKTSPAADWQEAPPDGRPVCPQCGGRLVARGRHTRRVLLERQPDGVQLQRQYGYCPACKAGLFPPGRGTGAAAG
jgi:hypothetical protein